MAAQTLGFRVCVLDPAADGPASAVADDHIRADFSDAAALARLGARCAASTTEFENVPAAALEALARTGLVSPAAASVALAQDRGLEKQFIASCAIEVAPHALIGAADQIDAAGALLPGILKTATMGYDGKGQVRVASLAEAHAAWHRLGEVACVLERQLDLALEISVIVCRARDGAAVAFPIAENQHRDGILAASLVPARIPEALAARARAAALALAGRMNYSGVLCVEFFVLADGRLIANEIAPRPHNSGHFTIDACLTSQFEQQARILAGLPLGDPGLIQQAVMLNILGDAWFDPAGGAHRPRFDAVLAVPGAALHLYGKNAPRRGRKMGHVTLRAPTLDAALQRAAEVAAALRIEAPG